MIEDMVAVDLETTGLRWSDRLLTVSLARKGESGIESLGLNLGYYQRANLFGIMDAALDSRDVAIAPLQLPEAGRRFREFIGRRPILVLHNGSFDIPYLHRAGLVTTASLAFHSIFDTMVLARATGPHEAVGLQALCAEIGVGDAAWADMKSSRAHLENEPYEELEAYGRQDAINTLELATHMFPEAVALYGPFGFGGLLDEESDWIKLVARLRTHGVAVDLERLEELESDLVSRSRRTVAALREAKIKGPNDRTGILAWAERHDLLGHLNRTPKSNYSCDSESLEQIIDASELIGNGRGEALATIAQLIIDGRSQEKALSTWIRGTRDRMGDDGRVHSLFTTSGAVSNRLSCKEPNIQAYPEDYKVFAARDGYELWNWDWGQAELRIAAMLGRDAEFARIFAQPDADPHMETALLLFVGVDVSKDHRAMAKRANFGSIYGAGVRAIMRTTGCNEGEAKSLLAGHRRVFKGLALASRQATHLWKTRGFLKLIGGKRRYASEGDLQRPYAAFNQLVQGSVAEVIKTAMLRIDREISAILLVNQVHDSVEAEVPVGDRGSVEAARRIMVEAVPEEIRCLTDPPIVMRVDAERVWPRERAA